MSKVISREQTEGFQRWDLPIVEDVSAAVADAKHGNAPGLMTAEQIERIQTQAYKEAYEAGFKKGRAEGQVAGQSEARYKEKLSADMLTSLAQPFEQLDDSVEEQLVSLSLAIARQLVRRELKADPSQVVGVVHEALAVLPVSSQNVKVCLHRDDVAIVREAMAHTEADRTWTLTADPGLQRGDCRIITDVSQIEATLEKRLTAVVTQMLGGERERDTQGTPIKTERVEPAEPALTSSPVSTSVQPVEKSEPEPVNSNDTVSNHPVSNHPVSNNTNDPSLNGSLPKESDL